jgi:hypothetical protein
MRGYPPIHLLVLMLAFGALVVPLVNLTTARQVKTTVPVAKQTASTIPTLIRLRHAHTPTAVSLKMGDQELLTSAGASPIETDAGIAIPEEGIELMLSATWPEGTPDTALTLEIEPDGMETKSETRWSLGHNLTEVISFQWR